MGGARKTDGSDVGRQMILAYVAGVITGLALFGAGSFYYERLFH